MRLILEKLNISWLKQEYRKQRLFIMLFNYTTREVENNNTNHMHIKEKSFRKM